MFDCNADADASNALCNIKFKSLICCEDDMIFVIGAAGYVESTNAQAKKAALFSIDHNKKIYNLQTGY